MSFLLGLPWAWAEGPDAGADGRQRVGRLRQGERQRRWRRRRRVHQFDGVAQVFDVVQHVFVDLWKRRQTSVSDSGVSLT